MTLTATKNTPTIVPGTLKRPRRPRAARANLDNSRRRVWTPDVDASGVPKPARIYDLRSTFASTALSAGVTVFELARVMGTSVAMIERHYSALLDGAGAGIAGRLDALDAAREADETRIETDG